MNQIISDVLQRHVSLECDNCIDGNHIPTVASDIEQALCQADVSSSLELLAQLANRVDMLVSNSTEMMMPTAFRIATSLQQIHNAVKSIRETIANDC